MCGKPFESEQYKTCEDCRRYYRAYYKANIEKVRVKQREYSYNYFKKNREKVLERQRRQRKANPDKFREKHKKYRSLAENREKEREYSRIYRERNLERERERYREYQKANPEKIKVKNHNRRARVRGIGGTLPKDIVPVLFKQQQGICCLCGGLLYAKLNDPVSIEHRIPISKGGVNSIPNIGLAHRSCNAKKGAKTVEEFLGRL